MNRCLFTLCLIVLVGTALTKRGGSSSRKTSKSGNKSGGSGSSYPKQQWKDPNSPGSPGSSKTAPAPGQAPPGYPSYPSYPGQNTGQHAQGHPYGAPPSYPAQGHPYPAPPAYSAPGHGYPAPPGYPGHVHPSAPQPPAYAHFPAAPVPQGPMKAPKAKSSIGTHVAAGVVGAVAGAALAKSITGPRIKIHGGRYYDGYYSSSEEYFDPYITGPHGRMRGDMDGQEETMTQEELNILQLAHLMERLCGKVEQPAVCTLLKLHGVRAFTRPNSIFNITRDNQRNVTLFEDIQNIVNNGSFPLNETTGSKMPDGNSVTQVAPNQDMVTTPSQNSATSLAPTQTTHLSEDRLKAVEDLIKEMEKKLTEFPEKQPTGIPEKQIQK